MNTRRLDSQRDPTDRLLAALADARRRRVLVVLRERREPVRVSRLATLVATEGTERPPGDERRRVRTALVHSTLPTLEDAGVVTWTDAGVAAVSAVLEEPAIDRLLATPAPVLRALADARRRWVLAALAARESPVDVRTLAVEVAGSDADVDAVLTMLVHVHLPHLADVGLVDYGDGRVTAAEQPVDHETLTNIRLAV